MSVAKIVELTATGSSIEAAVNEGVAKAGESLRNIEQGRRLPRSSEADVRHRLSLWPQPTGD